MQLDLDTPAAATLLLLALTGCSSSSQGGSTAATRDSAGIRIVDNAQGTWQAGQAWTIEAAPLISIAGTAEAELTQIVGAVMRPDGSLAAASALANAIRFFDSSGRPAGSLGRPGSGPGEFQALSGVWAAAGDSLVAADVMTQRLTVITPDGKAGRAYSLGGQSSLTPGEGGRMAFAVPMGALADGSVVGQRLSLTVGERRESMTRDTVSFIRYAPDGTAADTIASVPGTEMTQVTVTFGPQTVPIPTPVPLGKQTVAGIRGEHVFLAQNNSWQVERYRADGSLDLLIRAPIEAMRLSASDISVHRAEWREMLDAAPQMRAAPHQFKTQYLAQLDGIRYPTAMLWIQGLFPAPDGGVWIEEAVRPGIKQRQFAVVGPDGALLGRLSTPAGFRLIQVEADRILGVWTDDDGLEHVRVHRILKP